MHLSACSSNQPDNPLPVKLIPRNVGFKLCVRLSIVLQKWDNLTAIACIVSSIRLTGEIYLVGMSLLQEIHE